jgi:hypothetical protein
MAREDLTPDVIFQPVTGLWAADVLKGGLELQVFDHPSDQSQCNATSVLEVITSGSASTIS